MPARSFAITADIKPIALDSQGRGEIAFTVANTTSRPVRGQPRLVPLGSTKADWLTLSGETERSFSSGESHQFTVRIAAPVQAPPGRHAFRFNMVAVHDPEGDYTEGPAASFDIPERVVVEERRRLPWLLLAAAGIFIIGIAVIVGMILPRGPIVPNLVSMTRDQAESALQEVNLRVGEITLALFEEAEEGTVIQQEPSPGARARKNDNVDLTLADSGTIALPELRGRTRADAEAMVQSLGLSLSTVLELETDQAPAGTVINHIPADGMVPRGTSVELVVAIPVPTTPVPNVVGEIVFAAMEQLREAGFQIASTETREVPSRPPNTVLEQDPAANTPARAGTEVKLVVATTQAPVPVPRVTSMTRPQAEKAIADAGLRSKVVVIQKGGQAPGTVFDQNPAEKIPVPPNTVVTLRVIANPPPIRAQGRIQTPALPGTVVPAVPSQPRLAVPLITHQIDLDSGQIGVKSGADLSFLLPVRTAGAAQLLAPGRQQLAIIGKRKPFGPADCEEALLKNPVASIHVSKLDASTWVCTKTDEGRYSAFRVMKPVSASQTQLHLEYMTWEKITILFPAEFMRSILTNRVRDHRLQGMDKLVPIPR
jgi:beta-lactam-binding protein with PASTA domain